MSEITRVLIPLESHSIETFQTALSYAIQICKKTKASSIILLTHTKQQLKGTSLYQFLGDRAVKALSKGTVALSGGIQLRHETMQTLRWVSHPSVILAYYAETRILDLADEQHNIVGVVAVPDLPGEADDWATRWGTIVHGRGRVAPAALIEDGIVVRALEHLTQMINLSTGLGHPRDKEQANEVLRILRAKGHMDPTPKIRSWAIRNGWRPKDADELEKLSLNIWKLKNKPSIAKFCNAHERYDRWRRDED
ncbi:conserved hypothetical protein [uncultured Alphaproteobacteria bacterium]|uniref:Uncharacterized protein n=1 Tax=uncultured Alphaproteobacteria bacterium TaxID=91750 RepID=A0A212JZI8_9PROT|nr:conserved hypothetical protein [uncultured Alphaproteobacteria bacterium]